jgi:phosphoglycolate phosphatase-like HAD superfamily hydrolase
LYPREIVTLLALDFDGTMTDAELEGAPFTEGYLEDLALLVGRTVDDPELVAVAAAARARIDADPDAAFEWMGKKVAPSRVDPYLRIVPIAHAVLDHFGAFARMQDRGALLGRVLYKYNYAKTRVAPRPGARELLAALAGTDTYVVTNSYTAHVEHKIRAIDAGTGDLGWLTGRVRGNASKFEVDDAWLDAPPVLEIPGLGRPVLLRRRRYHAVLTDLLAGRRFDDLTVVGDIFELDLAMPLALGARVGLVAGPHTPDHEITYVAAHPRGRVLRDLDEIRQFAYPAGR